MRRGALSEERLWERTINELQMKYIIILGDGMADEPIGAFGGENALFRPPASSSIGSGVAAAQRRMLATVPAGFAPGSEIANLSVLGYDLPKVFEGRGSLEAASMGVRIEDGEMAMRCNLLTIEQGRIKDHSAGHITSEEAAELIVFLQKELGGGDANFFPGVSYRHLLKLKGGDKRIATTPPHDVPGLRTGMCWSGPWSPKAEATAVRINELVERSQELLKDHPVNRARVAAGKEPANWHSALVRRDTVRRWRR